MNINQLKEKVFSHLQKNDIKIVSFDIFDTLLHRIVPSEYVTCYSSEKLSQSIAENTALSISINYIFQSRCEFEKKKKQSKNKEWELQDWLFWAGEKLDIDLELFVKMGKQAEVEAEISSLKLLEGAHSFISELKEANYRVIAVSDMWLNSIELGKILNFFGISFDAVYTSGELKVSKKEGHIFKRIEKNFNFPSNDFLHIGDNLFSDFIRPRIAGWHSIWFPKSHPFLPFWVPKPFWKGPLSYQPYKVITQLLIKKNVKHISDDPLYNIGYNYLAPVLIIFSLIQYKYFKKHKIKSVFYLARDAKLPFEIYKQIFSLMPDSPEIHYTRLSRKSVYLLYPNNPLLNVNPVPGKVGRKNIGEWISNFVIDDGLKNEILQKAGESQESKFSDSVRKNIYEACKFFKDEIEIEREKQKKLIKKYLSDLIGSDEFKRISIVDSGWAGTIQDCLANILDDTDLICGVYLGVSKQGYKPCRRSLKFGILRDDNNIRSYHNPLYSTAGVIRVWETLLREPIGMVIRLKKIETGKILPELGNSNLIGENEKKNHEILLKSILQRVNDSSKQIHLLIEFLNSWSLSDLEKAAVFFSNKICIYPEKIFAKLLLDMNNDEGSAGGKKSSIGIQGIKDGIAWYPGIFTSLFGERLASVCIFTLKVVANFILFLKRH